ncbi:MAG: YjjG family noncanonical pyrimidine nucleotidase [Christensenellaceae bacterium]|nr:YjjG family noncanonical pyrimidine nucleotidase [Christensenellaceae bacterium]
MKYDILLLDADGTLLDFEENERVSIRQVLSKMDLPIPLEEAASLYSAINSRLWKEYDENKITVSELVIRRFEILLQKLGLEGDPQQMEKDYRALLDQGIMLIPGALEFLRKLRGKARVYIVTNGVTHTQHGRLERSGIKALVDGVFISGEIGAHKPQKEFFDYVFAHVEDLDKAKTLVVGDSLSSDIKGGRLAGLDTCFFNEKGISTGDESPTMEVRDFAQLEEALGL